MKKIFSLFIALTAVFSLSAKTLYLQPNNNWKTDNARFAVYAFNDSENVWYDLEAVALEDGIFSATIDDKYTKVIFCRMKAGTTENNWSNKWNQTQDMTIEAEKDQCNITGWDAGVWAKHGEVVIPAKFYITGDTALVVGAGVDKMKAWQPDAIKVTEDSYTFEGLAAGAYQLKVTEEGTWGTAKDIESMSEVAAGLYRDQDANICFILAAAGNVKVTYKKGESTEFTLEGAFVAPEMKLIGSFAGEWTGATEPIVMEIAADKKSASKTLNLTGEWYDFKVIRGTDWLGKENEGTENYKIHRDHNWVDGLKRDGEAEAEKQKAISLQPDVKGDYTFTYDFAAGKLTVSFPDPVLANGYYLIGKIGGVESTWDYASLKAEHLLALNEGAATEEYKIVLTLAEGDQFQVVRCDYDKLGKWYPGDEDKNYIVDGSHAGLATIYFRPKGDGDESWHHGCIQVIVDGPTAVDNTEATVKSVKTLENGMLIIEKNGVRYNVLGQSIR